MKKKSELFRATLINEAIMRFRLLDGNTMYSPGGHGAFDEFFVNYHSNCILDQYHAYRIKRNDIVIDCGAHIGCFSLAAVNQGAFVYAIEPLLANLTCLEFLMKQNHQMTIIPGVVSSYDGAATFKMGDEGTGAGKIAEDGDCSVIAMRIDTIVERFNMPKVSFIKMDIEGAELEAIEGAANTIERFKPNLAISAYHKPQDPRDLREALLKIRPDYEIRILRDNPFCENVLLAD